MTASLSTKSWCDIDYVVYRRVTDSTFILQKDGRIRFVGQVPDYRSKFTMPPPLPLGLKYVSIEECDEGRALIAEISNGEMIFFDGSLHYNLDVEITHRGRTAVTPEAWMRSRGVLWDIRMSIVSGEGGYWKLSSDNNHCPDWEWHATNSPVRQIESSKSGNPYGHPIILLQDGSLCTSGSSIADFVPEGIKFSRLITETPNPSLDNCYVIGVMESGEAIQLSPFEEGSRSKLSANLGVPILLPVPGHVVVDVEVKSEFAGKMLTYIVQNVQAPDGSLVRVCHYPPEAKLHASRVPLKGGVNYKKFCAQHSTQEWHEMMREIVARNPHIRPWIPSSAMRHGSMRGLVELLEM